MRPAGPMPQRFDTYEQFWPFYLRSHSKPGTRLLHYVGTILGVSVALGALLFGEWLLLPAAVASAYGLAWIGHYAVEKNTPATFEYPLWSFRSDWRMLFAALRGSLGDEMRRSGIWD